jgi:cytochrome c-type biogenesis protein CcmH
MTLWLVLTIMTSAAAVLVSAPFIRRFDRPRAESAGDIEVYRDQLKEVESELRQGLIDDAQAEAARVEIKRRALAVDRMERPALPKLSQDERKFAVICVTGIVVLGSVGLYAATGNPDLPATRGFGTASRATSAFAQEPSSLESLAAATQRPASEIQRQPRSQTSLPPVDEMIKRLATRLLQNPNDVEGWRTLGWSYLSIGRFSEAGEAYAKAIELSPDIAEIRSAHVEAVVRSADGVVTTDARNAIKETLRLDPKNARARFFKGLAEEQDGDRSAALTDWIELLKDANSDEPWVPDLKSRISNLERDIGVDAARSAAPKPVASGGLLETLRAQGRQMSRAVEKGPSQEDVRAAEAMPPAERSTMIRRMVDGLAARLEQSPHDVDGWIRLIRSRVVLGEIELAKQALAQSLEEFIDDTQQRDRIVAVAQEIGLTR